MCKINDAQHTSKIRSGRVERRSRARMSTNTVCAKLPQPAP
jgi:hypothetical protein